MKLALLPHQADFCADYTTPQLALVGGFGSGKSLAFAYKTVIMAGLNAGYEGAIMEPTNYMTRTILIPVMEKVLTELKIPYDFEKSLNIFHLHFREGSTKLYCLSGENYERLVGYNLAFAGSDETDTSPPEIAKAMWGKMVSRVRTGVHRQIYSTSTPEGYRFLYEHFVEKADDSKRIVKAKSIDNPFLPPEYIESMRQSYTPEQFRIWAEGEFGNLNSSLVYSSFDRNLNHSDLTLKDVPQGMALHVGMDFNIDNMAAVTHFIKDNNPIAIDELVKLKDVDAMIREIKHRYPARPIFVYPDASGKNRNPAGIDTSHAKLKQAGFTLRVNPSNPPVGDRINSMNAMFCNSLNQRRYLVNTRTCPTYANALERQGWVNGEPDKSNNIDHPLDAAGYLIFNLYPLRGKPTLRTY